MKSNLRERKIRALQEKQNNLKGISKVVMNNVENTQRTLMGMRPAVFIGERQEEEKKVARLKQSYKKLKKSPSKQLNKRNLFY